jgi:replication fork protection complex subunit Tof1/Swi1
MAESPLEDDQAIAENILSRLFYEETTHERIVTIVRSYTNQDFGYLDACTELAHVHLRVLEHYSKQNLEMHVRSRRRVRKKKAKATEAREMAAGTATGGANGEAAETHASEQEEVAEAQLASKERKFDFARFAARFMTQACVDTFVALATYYRELSPEQLKRAHRFFYRVAFKSELSVLLFRVDIIALLHKMIKGPAGLDLGTSHGKDWSELVRQLFKKLVRMIQQRPELIVELLFSKIGSTLYFLEHGHVKPVPATRPRIPAELEIKPGFDVDRQIGIVVTLLLEKNERGAIAWFKQVLASAVQERQAWEAEIALRHPPTQESENREEVSLPEAPSICMLIPICLRFQLLTKF